MSLNYIKNPDEIYQLGSYTVPKLSLQDGFSASFKVKISSETSLSADAFAVNFGDSTPIDPNKRNNYGGYEKGLTVEFNTYSAKGFRVFVDDQEIPNNFVSDTTLADGQWRDVQVEWLAPGSLTLSIDPELAQWAVTTTPFSSRTSAMKRL